MKNEIIYGEAVALNWKAPADGSTQIKVQLSPSPRTSKRAWK